MLEEQAMELFSQKVHVWKQRAHDLYVQSINVATDLTISPLKYRKRPNKRSLGNSALSPVKDC